MSNKRNCVMNLRAIVGKGEYATYPCVVTNVGAATCDVKRILDDLVIEDVRLNSTCNEEAGIIIYPERDSSVIVTDIDGHNHFISQFSEIDKIIIKTQNNIEIECLGEIIINGGNNGGLVMLEKLEDNLNKIKQYLNNLNTAISTGLGSTVGNAGVAAASTFTGTMSSQSLFFENMENEKIKH